MKIKSFWTAILLIALLVPTLQAREKKASQSEDGKKEKKKEDSLRKNKEVVPPDFEKEDLKKQQSPGKKREEGQSSKTGLKRKGPWGIDFDIGTGFLWKFSNSLRAFDGNSGSEGYRLSYDFQPKPVINFELGYTFGIRGSERTKISFEMEYGELEGHYSINKTSGLHGIALPSKLDFNSLPEKRFEEDYFNFSVVYFSISNDPSGEGFDTTAFRFRYLQYTLPTFTFSDDSKNKGRAGVVSTQVRAFLFSPLKGLGLSRTSMTSKTPYYPIFSLEPEIGYLRLSNGNDTEHGVMIRIKLRAGVGYRFLLDRFVLLRFALFVDWASPIWALEDDFIDQYKQGEEGGPLFQSHLSVKFSMGVMF